MRILIADDAPDVAQVVAFGAQITWPGCDVQIANNGADALKLFEAARPDEGLPNERLDEWMIENGLTTRDALEHARERARRMRGPAPP